MGRTSWRTLLITNAEMADLLTLLHAAGMPNAHHGAHLFVFPMPHERGGRLRYDAKSRRWQVSPGHESHPAYGVTWVGAAAMAAWQGTRLPTRAEALEACADVPPTNCDYAVGDARPVVEHDPAPGQVHLVGNLQQAS
ncbi:SUMF1/EgtB/PvdO family nonheme iron enzyme [Streptomyces sp. CA-288835]|uniref:SUMF1/EgtB/PvdO family nonheme iron enzyme n=1 Tax=Streptomyces sp. CA-288835 TaxID=3240069 RepID=UPI003D92DC41